MLHLDKWRYLKRLLILLIFTLTFLIIVYGGGPYELRRDEEPVFGWELNRTRDVGIYVVPSNDTALISGRDICDNKTEVVVVVTSPPQHRSERQAIRQTWARHNYTYIKILFILGLPSKVPQDSLEEESSLYQDIVQEGFIDSYNNLTIKSVMMIKWFLRHCPKATFLMKTDDDMFVNITMLSKVVSKFKKPNLLIGCLMHNVFPIKHPYSKWYSPRYMYHKKVYPNYLSGTGYLMTRDVAEKIYKVALSIPLFYIEDIFITGLCAEYAGIKPRNHRGFSFNKLMEIGCHPLLVTMHGFSPSDLINGWANRFNCSTVEPFKPVLVTN